MILSSTTTTERGKLVQKTANISISHVLKVGKMNEPTDIYHVVLTTEMLDVYHNGKKEISIHHKK